MLPHSLSKPGLIKFADKITATAADAKALKAELQDPARAAAAIARLHAVQNASLNKLETTGKVGWVNDPDLGKAVLVEKGTGRMVVAMDGRVIQNAGKVTVKQIGGFANQKFRQQFLQKMRLDLETSEGFEPHMYLDTLGVVTIGIGHALETVDEAKLLPLYHKSGKQPKPQDIENDFKLVKRKNYINSPASYEAITHMRMSKSDAEALAEKILGDYVDGLMDNVPFSKTLFESFPAAVQEALADFVYNVGETKFIGTSIADRIKNRAKSSPENEWHGFPCLIVACWHRDWALAAAESSRSQVQQSRNAAVQALFNAAVEDFYIGVSAKINGNVQMVQASGSVTVKNLGNLIKFTGDTANRCAASHTAHANPSAAHLLTVYKKP